MEILPFLAVLFKTGTALSILGSWMPAVRAREKHGYPCAQMPLPINQKAPPEYLVLRFQIIEIIMSKHKMPIFPNNKPEILLRCSSVVFRLFTNALSCVKSFCICRGG